MGRIPRAGKRGHVSAILRPSRLAGAAGIARAASRPIARARSTRISGPDPDPEGGNEDQSLRKLATTGDPHGVAWALGAIGVAGGAAALVAARRRVR